MSRVGVAIVPGACRPHQVVRARRGVHGGRTNLASMSEDPVRSVLSIAGSDSGGGAGIQADLKAFARCGVHGTTAITALTAQNTTGVYGVHTVPEDFIVDQVRAVIDDIRVDAVKIGMLATTAIVGAVDRALDLLSPNVPVVIDTVMVAESGAVLLDDAARTALIERLIPRAAVITPNLPEARILAATAGLAREVGAKGSVDEAEHLVRALHGLGSRAVVLTGGHREEIVDLFFDGRELVRITGSRHADGAAHGSGCTHSSALAAHLALGHAPLDAARRAKVVASDSVRDGLRDVGRGAGPVDVFGLGIRQGGESGHGQPGAA
jgi:hydroxymethylpyrimidine/phosphomethylpyrimidine kinase